MSVLGPLVIRLGGVLQETSVLDGNLVADLGDGAIALLQDSLLDTHCGCGNGEVALGSGCE